MNQDPESDKEVELSSERVVLERVYAVFERLPELEHRAELPVALAQLLYRLHEEHFGLERDFHALQLVEEDRQADHARFIVGELPIDHSFSHAEQSKQENVCGVRGDDFVGADRLEKAAVRAGELGNEEGDVAHGRHENAESGRGAVRAVFLDLGEPRVRRRRSCAT